VKRLRHGRLILSEVGEVVLDEEVLAGENLGDVKLLKAENVPAAEHVVDEALADGVGDGGSLVDGVERGGLDDSTGEEGGGGRGDEQGLDHLSAGRLTGEGDLGRVTAEGSDVRLYPACEEKNREKRPREGGGGDRDVRSESSVGEREAERG
jgi:hypothetical protein